MFQNLVLIGFMGSGKSSVGRLLASLTGFGFVDTDALVAQAAGLSIPEIFREYGEEHFRDRESDALRSLLGRRGLVVATGGGIVLREENRKLLREIGAVVWLDARMDVLFERVKHSKRPLLQTDEPRRTVEALYRSREALYAGASDLRVDSSALSHKQAAREVLARLRKGK